MGGWLTLVMRACTLMAGRNRNSPPFRDTVEAIQRNTKARHIEMRIGVAQKCCRVRTMHDAWVNACHTHVRDGLGEAAELHVEIERLGAVGRSEVGERAHMLKRGWKLI